MASFVRDNDTPFTLEAMVRADEDAATAITATVPITFTVPPPADPVRTIILHYPARLAQKYPGQAAAVATLTARLEALAAHPDVAGVVVDLGSDPDLAAAYARWDAKPDNPALANHVAANLKSFLYSLSDAYPNWEYLVLVGGDQIIPYRRLRDVTFRANERAYADADFDPALAQARAKRYFLSDDYYAGLLPLPHEGREFYLPQVAVGRLVEAPAEITAQVDAFLARPVLAPQDALVTGYDFLIDAAQAMSRTLATYGVTNKLTVLADDNWTAQDFRNALFGRATAPGLVALNSHFTHYSLYPNDPVDVYATEVTPATAYRDALVFSMGCHSGLNMPDAAVGRCHHSHRLAAGVHAAGRDLPWQHRLRLWR